MANFKTIVPLQLFFLSSIVPLLLPSCLAYNVVSFGARGDGRTDSTTPFLRTWMSACSSASPANVYVPQGTYVIRPVTFTGPCRSRIEFRIDGTIVAPPDYNAIGGSSFWILFYKVSGLSVYGGTIDAKGQSFWSCRRSGNSCPPGARSLTFLWCNNVLLSGLKSYNSQMMHVAIDFSSHVKVEYLSIRAPSGSPNTDGIHVENSMDVTIIESIIRTGDDCISIGPGSMNLWIQKIGCGPGHGISIGSLANTYDEAGVQNITVANSVFTKTQNGVRIKSWPRASAGFAKNIEFRNLVMRNVGNPILIDQNYCPDNNCPHQGSGVMVSEVTYKNVKGTSSTQQAIKLDCSNTTPCSGIRLQDIKLTFMDRLSRPALTYCRNAHGRHGGKVIPKSCF